MTWRSKKSAAIFAGAVLLMALAVIAIASLLHPNETSAGNSWHDPAPAAPEHEPSAPMAEDAMAILDALGYGAAEEAVARKAPSEPSGYARKLIREAEIQLETDDPLAAAKHVTGQARASGGYVLRMGESQDNYGRKHVYAVVRVPGDNLDAFLNHARSQGVVLNQSMQTSDVAAEYTDVEARMRNLLRMEERLLALLDREGPLEEVLRVEQELGRIRGQIEEREGRLRYLDNRVEFATVTCNFRQRAQPGPVWAGAAFSSSAVTVEAVRALMTFLQALWVRAIWIGVWTPVWLPTTAVCWWLVRRWSSRRRLSASQ